MTKAIQRRLDKLEAKTAPVLPFKIMSYGLPDDGRYHGEHGESFTPEQFEELQRAYQIILVGYTDAWRPGEAAE